MTVWGLMLGIAGLALILGAWHFSGRWADDWADDRRQASVHQREADFLSEVLRSTHAHRAAHPTDRETTWFIHSVPYRLDPELDRYLIEAIAYHRRQAGRYERAVGRPWTYVTPEPPPSAPAAVPVVEVAASLNRPVDDDRQPADRH
jgi:hypothetical protein